ncbi:DUF4328 domain-containing protein [Aquimarina sp. MMG016]|uniref:DUF4328 domain-containing protein n=1 Tax=Aquimarina sp. MMG016 TaxID=2822690 RepID=UPI0032B4F520
MISLFRPYSLAREITTETKNRVSQLNPEHKSNINFSIIGFWWALFIITNYIGSFAFKTLFKDDTIDQFITSTQAYMFSDFMDIPAAILTLVMIQQISKEEKLLFDSTQHQNTDDNIKTSFIESPEPLS